MNQARSNFSNHEIAGAGLGLRSAHFETILEQKPRVAWFEALTENYFCDGGVVLRNLEKIRSNYPLVFHGVAMNLGSADGIDHNYLKQLKSLVNRFEPTWISDHLCWSGVDGSSLHDLLPLPFTEETIKTVANNIISVQEALGERILIENISSYLEFKDSTKSEVEFLNEVSNKADCSILLDINNVFVNASNHGFGAEDYINQVDYDRVKQIHLAGHDKRSGVLIDTHGSPVCTEVWELYRLAIKRLGRIPTLIEWDQDIPEFNVLLEHAELADKICQEALH